MTTSRWIALGLISLVSVPGCGGGGGKAADAAPSGSASGPAGEAVTHLTDIASYHVETQLGTGMNVQLIDGMGATVGTVEASGTAADGAALTLNLVGGGSAKLDTSSYEDGTGDVFSRAKLQAEGQTLEIESHFDVNHAERDVRYLVAGEPIFSPIDDGITTPPDELARVLDVVRDGTVADKSDVEAWLSDAGIDALMSSDAARTLYLVASDEALTGLLAEALGQFPADDLGSPGTLTQGIHKSPLCSSLIAAISAGGAAAISCGVCVPSAAALPESAGFSAILAIPSCAICLGITGLSVTDLIACAGSYFNRYELSDCQQSCAAWKDPSVSSDEHGCDCKCNTSKCEAACIQQFAGTSTTYCSTTNCLGNTCTCIVSKCGDGIISNTEACTEECDPMATPTGCGTGQRCMGCKCVKDFGCTTVPANQCAACCEAAATSQAELDTCLANECS